MYAEEYGVDSTFEGHVASAIARAAVRGFPTARELLARAGELGYRRAFLETFSELRTAAHLYREHGFELTSAETAPRWGRGEITYQRYELELEAALARLSA